MDKVTTAVKEVFGRINPREEITLEKLSELTLEVRKKVEGATDEQRRYEILFQAHSPIGLELIL